VSPATFPAEPEQQLSSCLQQSGLLQPLLPTGESGNSFYTFAAYQVGLIHLGVKWLLHGCLHCSSGCATGHVSPPETVLAAFRL
jgi:hypothetical protein